MRSDFLSWKLEAGSYLIGQFGESVRAVFK